MMGGMCWGGSVTGTVTFFGTPMEQAAVHLEGVEGVGGNASSLQKREEMVQKGQLFIPAILPVMRGTTVDFPNKDTVFHNAFSMSPGNAFNFGTYGPGKTPHNQFNTLGKVDVFCNMHEQMHAVVLVLDHPYYALTSKKGVYEIKNIPPGTYRIKAWVNPTKMEEKKVTVSVSNTQNVDFNFDK
jgi:plastocyanin